MASVELTNRRFTVQIILSALCALLLGQSSLKAQVPSRAELLEAERETKVEEVRAPERTTIERGMRAIERAATKYENIKGRDPGLHYTTGNLPTGSGMGFGLGYTYSPMIKGGYSDPTLPNLFELKIDAAYSTREYYEGKAEIRLSNIAGSILNVASRAKYHEDPQEDFFGLGPQSERRDRTNYLLREFEGTTEAWLSPHQRISRRWRRYISDSERGKRSRFPIRFGRESIRSGHSRRLREREAKVSAHRCLYRVRQTRQPFISASRNVPGRKVLPLQRPRSRPV